MPVDRLGRMRALYFSGGRAELRRNHPVPVPAPGEALVQVRCAGICGTDLELLRGYAGFEGVAGHEFVGRVEAAADREWLGRRVVGSINVGCGRCRECKTEGPEHCPGRQVIGLRGRAGAFADYLALPVDNLLAVPEVLGDGEAVFAEPLAAAWRVHQQLGPLADRRVAVLGPGRLGLLVAQVLALDTPEVTVLGRRPESLAVAERLGLPTGLAAEAAGGFEVVVEATGSAAGLVRALELLRPRGTVVLKSTFAGAAAIDPARIVVPEVRLVGSRCGPLAPALELMAAGRVRVGPLVEASYPLAEGPAALAHAARPGALKVLLEP